MTRAELEEENAALRAENTVLLEQVQALVARVQELVGRLAKDSHNSSTPPSSDGLVRKPQSLRQRSETKPGGQPGHRGHQLRPVAQPEVIIARRPATCGGCHAVLSTGAWSWVELGGAGWSKGDTVGESRRTMPGSCSLKGRSPDEPAISSA